MPLESVIQLVYCLTQEFRGMTPGSHSNYPCMSDQFQRIKETVTMVSELGLVGRFP